MKLATSVKSERGPLAVEAWRFQAEKMPTVLSTTMGDLFVGKGTVYFRRGMQLSNHCIVQPLMSQHKIA